MPEFERALGIMLIDVVIKVRKNERFEFCVEVFGMCGWNKCGETRRINWGCMEIVWNARTRAVCV